jgi:hypothetical protein
MKTSKKTNIMGFECFYLTLDFNRCCACTYAHITIVRHRHKHKCVRYILHIPHATNTVYIIYIVYIIRGIHGMACTYHTVLTMTEAASIGSLESLDNGNIIFLLCFHCESASKYNFIGGAFGFERLPGFSLCYCVHYRKKCLGSRPKPTTPAMK